MFTQERGRRSVEWIQREREETKTTPARQQTRYRGGEEIRRRGGRRAGKGERQEKEVGGYSPDTSLVRGVGALCYWEKIEPESQ